MEILKSSVGLVSPIRQWPSAASFRGYLKDLAAVAHETATSPDPEVIQLGLKLLARQAPILATLAGTAR